MTASIKSAISAGLEVEAISDLGSFTETDPCLSFHLIPRYFEYIAEGLKWQSTNIISEDFLSKQLCSFLECGGTIYFCSDSNNSGTPKWRYTYKLELYFKEQRGVMSLSGPNIKESDMQLQFKSQGFILWPAFNEEECLFKFEFKYGTFRQFYPNYSVRLLQGHELLRCEYNTKKGIKYLKLLGKSYVDRLSEAFDALPEVLLAIISCYVLGELLLESLYW
ncbi:MAG: hypothetical protein Hyperionvirus40_11 [Hyperionvirus sp.]|uniref:Uncharacterized protein n=1 Tax=Hyperionvirus sp. TaxID=2487770 RepID=A0A3G5ACC3_9VIRU|nr:MAG: hypothetical protein Hyperionvirus40_11 [Hyperionvirus sp.]